MDLNKLLVQLLNLKTDIFSFKVKIITIAIIAVKQMLKKYCFLCQHKRTMIRSNTWSGSFHYFYIVNPGHIVYCVKPEFPQFLDIVSNVW